MNSGATIFDDRETVEFLRDRPHLLAIADAVRATQRERTRSALRRNPLRIAAAAALVACATAAAVIAFLAFPANSRHAVAGGGPTHPPATRGGPPSPPNLGGGSNAHGLPAVVPLSKAKSDALSAFGEPLILPDTPTLKPSDVESTAFEQSCPATPAAPAGLCQMSVQFSSPSLGIQYSPTASTYWGSHYPDALKQYQAEIAQSSNPRDQIVDLSGTTPALIDPEATGIGIEFRVGTLSVTIWAPNINSSPTVVDAAMLQAFAQSIVNQAGNQ